MACLWKFLILYFVFAPSVLANELLIYERIEMHTLSIPAEHRTQLDPGDWEWLRNKEALVWGTYPLDLPPFEFDYGNQEVEGLTADVVAFLGRELGVNVVVHRYQSRDDAIQAMQSGEVDILGTVNATLNSADIELSNNYVHANPVMFRRAQDSWAAPNENWRNRTIGYNPAYISSDRLKALYPNASVVAYASNMALFSAVAFGGVSAGVSSSISAYFMLNKHYPNELRVMRMLEIPGFNGYRLAVHRNNKRLLHIINAAINEGLSESVRHAILHRWSGGGVIRTHKIMYSRVQRAWIGNNPIVRIGVAENFPPFSYYGNDDHYYGVTADFLSVIQAETGFQFQIKRFATLKGLFEALAEHQIDMVADVTPTKQRLEFMDFTRPYLVTPMALVVRSDGTQARTLAALEGKTLVLPKRHALIPFIRQHYPNIHIMEVPDVPDAFRMVKDGAADALLQPLNTARYYIIRLYRGSLQISATFDGRPAIAAFALRRGEDELKSIINQALLNIEPDEVSMLSNRWFSQIVIAPQSWRSYRDLIYQASAVAGLLFLVFLAWIFYLWQQIRKRKRAEKELNEQFRFMNTLINGTPHPIYVRDSNMRLIICNDSYLHEYRVSNEHAIGSTRIGHGALDMDDEAELTQAHLQVIDKREALILDRRLTLHNTTRTLYHWLLPYDDVAGKMRGVIGGWIDVSQRDELIAALQAARDQANLANRTKTTFLATMSHEIRTPLNAVLGMLELTLARNIISPQDRAFIKTAHSSARGLLELIGEILDISRIETGKLILSPRRSNIRSLVESVVQVFDGLARQKSLALKLNLDPALDQDVLIDPLRFKQVLSNLISNAIKFTHQGGVELSVQAECTDGESLDIRLCVADSGIGISAQDQNRLFQPFSQVRETSGGAGLGLMISRGLCQLMGGSLELMSQEGEGTQAIMSLRVQRMSKEMDQSDETSSPPAQLSKLKILIVDDHATNRTLLAYQLEYLQQSVAAAENGLRALELWRAQRYDLVITDCNMPLMDGFALAVAIREDERVRGLTPCIILGLTANAQKEMHNQCLQAGMNGCLFKPIELADLQNELHKFNLPEVEAHADLIVINFEKLKNTSGGNAQIVLMLLREMLGSTEKDLSQLKVLSPKVDVEELAILAHRIKGAAQVVKAEALVEKCRALEVACLSQSIDEITRQKERLSIYLVGFCKSLQDLLGENE